MTEKRPMVILTGPTAVGKTALSIELAKKINGSIISADSMQVYRHMDIGSAKVMPEEMDGVRHYLIDEFEPDEEFHVVKFVERAKEHLEEIYAEGKIPIIAGGTGELSDDFYDYIRQLNILNSPVMLYANGYADLVRGMGYLRVKMDDELSDIFAFILSSDKVSAEDAKIIREFKADTDTGKTSVYQEKMGELRIKYDELFKEFSSMQQDYILKKIIAGYLGTDQGLFFDLQKMMKYAQKISDFTPLTVHDFEEIRKMSDPYYLGRLTKMNNRLLETIDANKKKKGYTVNESGEVKDEDLFYSIISKFKGKVILVDFWATWCGPCKMAMKQMKPMKKDLEGKDIVYVFIAGENSPKETWDNMIPDIHGEHYRVTAAQWKYLSKQFSIQGVPTYIIVDKEGAVIQKHTGFPGVDTVKKELMKALEK